MTDIRPALNALVDDEPELGLSLDTVLAAGKVERRHRRTRLVATFGLPVVALGAAAGVFISGSDGSSTPTIAAPSPTTTSAPVSVRPQLVSYAGALASLESGTKPVLGPREERIFTAVRSQSPVRYQYNFNGPQTGDGTLEGTVSNGTGSGAFYVSINPSKEYLESSPCQTVSMGGSGACRAFTFGDGAQLLSGEEVSYPAKDGSNFRTIEVTYKLEDGSHIVASASNVAFGADGSTAGASDELLYTRDQLTVIAKAIYDELHQQQ